MATTPDSVFDSCARSDRLLAGALGPSLQRAVLVLTAAAALLCVVVAAVMR